MQEYKYFHLGDGVRRCMHIPDTKKLRYIKRASWFNKATDYVSIKAGHEITPESSLCETMYFIDVGVHIDNYFEDTSGLHFRNRLFLYYKDTVYVYAGETEPSKPRKRLSKELKGILQEIKKESGNGVY